MSMVFDSMVAHALKQAQELAPLQAVVEKELLHHDILRILAESHLLTGLTFMGGTCLRACYGSNRLSEDLDFTGGADFSMQQLQSLSAALTEGIHAKYGLQVQVEEPRHEKSNVSTWKVRITTRPAQQHMPAQRIHLDICAVPSYDIRPMVLRNYYGVEMGTSSLILQVQSREEILADKIVALALRPNRMKNRDLWDIGWLTQQGITLPAELLPLKICDHHCEPERFTDLLNQRMDILKNNPQTRQNFTREMRRFLPTRVVNQTIAQEDFWQYLVSTISEQGSIALKAFEKTPGQSFSM